MTLYTTIESQLGELLLVGDGRALQGLYMQEGGKPATIGADWIREPTAFDDVRVQLDEYFAGARTQFAVPLEPAGTPFQLRVWRALAGVGYGETSSYATLAVRLGHPAAARAVGAANGANPISVLIPCHRLVGTDGRLTGYAGGLERKRLLLELEARLALRGSFSTNGVQKEPRDFEVDGWRR